MSFRKLLLLYFLLFAHRSTAQSLSAENLTRYTTTNGLSNNFISGLAQDAAGYVWVATAAGLNRFNGSHFVQFHSNDNNASLASEDLTRTAWLDDRRLAVYSSGGLHIVDTRSGKTKNLFIPYKKQQYLYKFNTVHGAKADSKGNIYILTRSGFYHFKNDSLVWRFDYYKEEELDKTHFHFGGELFDFDNGHLLIVSVGGLYLYDKENRTLKKIKPADCPDLTEYVRSSHRYFLFLQRKPGEFFIFKDGSDSLMYLNTATRQKSISRLPFPPFPFELHYRTRLISESDSVLYLTGHNSGFYRLCLNAKTGIVRLDAEKQFASFLCTSLLKDRDGQLWIGTNKGLFRQDAKKTAVQFTALPQGLTDSFPNVRLTDIYASADKVYAGACGEAGLLIFDKKTLRYEGQVLFDKHNRANNQVTSLVPIRPPKLLLGTYNVPQWFDMRTKTTKALVPKGWNALSDWTNDLQTDRAGNVWLSSSTNLYQYVPDNGRFATVPLRESRLHLPVVLEEDRQGYMWMASHGIARYNTSSQSFDQVVDSFPFIKMPDRQVNALAFDATNTLWFNSANNGLIAYNLAAKTFQHYTTSHGLPDNNVVALLAIGQKLWIAAYSGLACLDLNTRELFSFGPEDGFPDMPIVKGARFFYDSATHEVY
ncbi:MAG TPA: two-component regulator propeller domain-containing protein, partial [Flavisolibacter sp.]|nr:two-component regulator propeller domain-containing protein [Flavisolibacter sp.]